MTAKTKVLIADDNCDFQSLLAESFSFHEDFEVIGTAFGGCDAFEKVCLLKPDVVILDILMPQIDGIGVMKKIKESPINPKPLIIAISCFVNDSIISEITQQGAHYFMIKPFDPDILIDRIRQFLKFKSFTGLINKDNTDPAGPIEAKVISLMNHMGISPNLSGFQYIKDALMISYEDDSMVSSVTKLLYPEIAKKNKTTSSRVERAIRHAIEMAFNRNGGSAFKEIFGASKLTRPTNSDFIATLSEKLHNEKTS